MNIDYFREFIVLADCASYIEASERLFIGQSSLSKHIMAMEKELGVPLFERTSRRVVLTSFGRLMLSYANRIVQTQYDYQHALKTEQESAHGRITIGTISATAKYGITNLLTDFKKNIRIARYRCLREIPTIWSPSSTITTVMSSLPTCRNTIRCRPILSTSTILMTLCHVSFPSVIRWQEKRSCIWSSCVMRHLLPLQKTTPSIN